MAPDIKKYVMHDDSVLVHGLSRVKCDNPNTVQPTVMVHYKVHHLRVIVIQDRKGFYYSTYSFNAATFQHVTNFTSRQMRRPVPMQKTTTLLLPTLNWRERIKSFKLRVRYV